MSNGPIYPWMLDMVKKYAWPVSCIVVNRMLRSGHRGETRIACDSAGRRVAMGHLDHMVHAGLLECVVLDEGHREYRLKSPPPTFAEYRRDHPPWHGGI